MQETSLTDLQPLLRREEQLSLAENIAYVAGAPNLRMIAV
jgi:hypothetical protein